LRAILGAPGKALLMIDQKATGGFGPPRRLRPSPPTVIKDFAPRIGPVFAS